MSDGVLGFWDRANATMRIALLAFAFIVAVSVFNRFGGKPVNVDGPTASEGFNQVTVVPDIPKKDVVVPTGHKPDDYIGRLDLVVTNQYVVTKADTPGTVIRTKKDITVLIPKDDSAPPVSPQDSSVQATYGEIATPLVEVNPSLVLGGVVDEALKPSPFAGASILHAFKKLDLGIGICRGGMGPFVGYEFFREFAAFGQWNPVQFTSGNSRYAIGILYRF